MLDKSPGRPSPPIPLEYFVNSTPSKLLTGSADDRC